MTGSARIGVPIEVPPGAGGFAPQLKLDYASQAGDSPYGTGFRLSLGPVPLGEIRVSTRFLPNGSLTYELDGERLVQNGARFHTAAAESFRRITREGSGPTAGWLVELPDGTKARYGQDASSRFPANAPTRWLLSAVSDKSGNTIRISYADVNAGTPSVIAYSYQGAAPTAPAIGGLREIRFVYETRPDLINDFMGYELRRITQRLREIRVLTGGNVFRRYSVLYKTNGPGEVGGSRVASVQMFGTDCTNLTQFPEAAGCTGMPSQRFAYTINNLPAFASSQTGPDDANGVPVGTFFTDGPGGPLVDTGVRPGDVNGDGLPDLVQAYRDPQYGVTQRVFLNTGDGWSADTNNSFTASLQSIFLQDKKIRAFKSGNFIFDIQVLDNGLQIPLFSDRTPVQINALEYVHPQRWLLTDLNGDGYADLVTSYLVGLYAANTQIPYFPGVPVHEVWLNNGFGWTRSPLSDDPSSYRAFSALSVDADSQVTVHDYHPQFGDFDGDTLPDLAVLSPDQGLAGAQGYEIRTLLTIERSPFSGFTGFARGLSTPQLPSEAPIAHHVFSVGSSSPNLEPAARYDSPNGSAFVDINRDGITDFVKTGMTDVLAPFGLSTCTFGDPDVTGQGVWLGQRGGGFCSSQEGCPEAIRYLPPVALNDTAFCFGNKLARAEDTGVRMIDANGDGWIDVVKGRTEIRSSGTQSVRDGYLYNPSAGNGTVWTQDLRFAPGFDLVETTFPPAPLQPYGTKRTHLQFVDINSDGAEDCLYAGGKKISRTTLPGLIASVDNGRGGTINFAHQTDVVQRSRDFRYVGIAGAVLYFDSVLPGELGLPALPRYSTPRWTKRPVVVTQTKKDMTEVGVPDAVTQFTYVAPGYSLENRSSLGFAAIQAQLPDGSFARTIFAQQKGVAGRPVEMVRFDSVPQQISEVRNVYAVRDGGAVPGSVTGVLVPRQVAAKSRTLYPSDPMPLGQYTQETTLGYDDSYGYNFVSSLTEQSNTGRLVRTFTPSPASTFINATTYLPGLPSRVEGRDSASRLLSRDDLAYDTTGRITRRTSLIQARDNPGTTQNRVTDFSYDVYGNMRSILTGAVAGTPLVSEFICYDGDTALGTGTCPNPTGSLNSHSVVVGMRDALGKLTTIVPNPTTGLPGRVVAFNGDVEEAVFDRFGRAVERAVDPIRGTVARTVLERRVYGDFYIPGSSRPFIEAYARTGSGSEEIRSAILPDGFGRVVRTTEQLPAGYTGKLITRNPITRTVRETFAKACADPFCQDLTANDFPATITTSDPLGRVVQVEEWGDAQTRNAISLAQFERASRAQPSVFTPPGASTYFESVLTKNAKGDLTRRILDRGRLVWSEECGNSLAPAATSLAGVSCNATDTSYFVYDATGEETRLYDPTTYPNGPFTDPNHYVGLAFDTLGQRLSSSDPDGGTTQSVFNVLGQETQVTNARNQITTFTYDLLGRLKTINRPGTEPDSTLTYSDQLSQQGNRDLARVVNATAGFSPTQEDFQYDSFDNVSYRKARSMISSITTELVTRFQSDLLGRPTRIDYPDASTSVAYTYVGQLLTRVCELNTSGVCAVDYLSKVEYDSLGRESKAFGPTYTPSPGRTPYETTTYDPKTYRVKHQELATVQSLQGNADARANFDYQYDSLGNVTAIDDLNPTSDTSLAPFSDASYTYDSRNRLTSRMLGGVTKYYKYDRLGNLTGNLLSSTAAAANQTYSDPQRPHAIQATGSTIFAYDADGNMTRRGTQFLGYNAENKLTCSGTSTSCTTVRIGYDAAGLRSTEVTTASTTFYVGDLFEYSRTSRVGTAHVFALGREIAFKKIPTVTLRTDSPVGGLPLDQIPQFLVLALLSAAAGLMIVVLLRSGAASAWVRRPAYASGLFALTAIVALPPQTWAAAAFPPAPSGVYRRWLSGDQVGSAVYVYDEQGRRAHKRVFEPFGGVFDQVNSESTPREFATHQFDSSLGLYYMKARFYDPTVGRFTSLDPLIRDPATIESVNPYSYVENNPINFADPTGLSASGKGLDVCPGGPCPGPDDNPPGTDDVLNDIVRRFLDPDSIPPASESFESARTAANEIQAKIAGNIAESFGSAGGDLVKRLRNDEVPSAQNPRTQSPFDFYTLTINAGPVVGVTFVVNVTEFGQIFVGIGPNVGRSMTLISGSLTGGTIDSRVSDLNRARRGEAKVPRPTKSELSDFLSGVGITAGFGGGPISVYGNISPFASGQKTGRSLIGISSPQIGASVTFSIQIR